MNVIWAIFILHIRDANASKGLLFTFLLLLRSVDSFSQNNNSLRSIDKLVDTTESGWDLVQKWVHNAKNDVVVLPHDSSKAKEVLYHTQVTTRSPMGAIIYYTGGLMIDHGWIRILGGGCSIMERSIPEWNKGKSFKEYGEKPPFLLIGDDAVGGFFAINGGALGPALGKVFYLSPDALKWEEIADSYTEFLHFVFNGDLNKFYKGLRWKSWLADVSKLGGDDVFSFYPFLWTYRGKNINKDIRKAVPVEGQYELNMGFIQEMNGNAK